MDCAQDFAESKLLSSGSRAQECRCWLLPSELSFMTSRNSSSSRLADISRKMCVVETLLTIVGICHAPSKSEQPMKEESRVDSLRCEIKHMRVYKISGGV